MRTSAAALVLASLVASHARADAIGPPPTTCPPGAHGVSSHSGSWCEPTECTPQTDCNATMRDFTDPSPATGRFGCRPNVGLCVRSRQIPEGGDAPQGSMVTQREALSACRVASDCPADAPCTVTSRCGDDPGWVSPASPTSGAFWRRAFYCDDEPSRPSRGAGLFLGLGGLGLAAVLAFRRRRR